ncbi:hypothetical protein CLAFUW4_03287 [Fulvia fulva]|uniref:Uncharacterized protein n=1 Tax=Passalora fulva TaxID=5499 RepID=A0A9Q8P658_PASFU|nr:uncharacterized protein CLAFUR5_03268 [Fulvia fulva]KAK4632196.1 hypothetical protein CLAFUR4_03276 [Fulvia fulva]KAK4632983.1 hypothetical protein CLAFUR0_03280 [Fulvia fulva]UJO14477.1 hypothetical protein CLAFUR5_03268 [Fulvia fulva]WPV11287.1 hypothetical protein CLAFUW4_03287 [Fulvia fulva]WPV25487.1 hypothetical protein CLAFUW7_03280 [Fulvia fulva]
MAAGDERHFGQDVDKDEDKDNRYDDLWKDVDRRGRFATVEAKTFTSTQLRRIGEVCSKRLPPASAVQAMFMYELQRESEVESLFHDHMFRLAKQDDKSAEQEKRIAALETRLTQVERAAASKDIEERLATSKVTMKVQQGKIDSCTGQVKDLETKLSDVQKELETLRSKQEEATTQRVDDQAAARPDTQTMADEINVLFDDRDGILEMITEVKSRLVTLEDNIRALTIQGTSIKTPSVSPQLIPVQNGNGQVVHDLEIPKGRAHVSMKENRKPSSIRSFSPGKQWAA